MEDLEGIFDMLVETRALHSNETQHYRFVKRIAKRAIAASDLRSIEPKAVPFGPFGDLILPYYAMGAIDTLDLFGLDELIIFAFYRANRQRYRCATDIGANLGLHAILMARCGFSVTAYEPDPVHFELLRRNLGLNKVEAVKTVKAAVSDRDGSMEFVRVKGNTTGSHLAGSKANPYGDLERFPVEVRKFDTAVAGADFVKIDAEGHEAVIVRSLPPERWDAIDAMLEVGTTQNAVSIFEHFRAHQVNMFSQKTGWSKVTQLSHVPSSHLEGSLFVTRKSAMPWG
jgi:FkbM family methyltransferase